MEKKTFENYNHLVEINLDSLGQSYDTLRIYYDHTTKYAAIYNFCKDENIIILDLEKTKNRDNDVVIKKNNKYPVYQCLIYSNYNADKILLIVSDSQGIKFYNIKGYATFLSFNDPGKLVKFKNLGYEGCIDFIDSNKVIWARSGFFEVFELKVLIKS